MRQGRIISRRSLELRLAYKAALVLRLSAEVVALRATLSSALSGHLLSKEGFQMCALRAIFICRLRRRVAKGADYNIMPRSAPTKEMLIKSIFLRVLRRSEI